jgi:trimethylamine---corrinoid protein Co-methyltransferase
VPTLHSHSYARAGHLSYLADDDKSAIYESALEIMATVGQRVHHPEALDLLRTAGCDVVEPDLVRVPRELVERARATALAVIEVFDRDGEPAMSLGSCTSCFGNGSAVTSVYDLETREHRPTRLDDGVMAARLCDALPNIDFVMAYAHPGEVDPHRSLLESFRAMVANTTKPLAAVADNAADLEVMWKIACELRGGAEELRAKPYFTVYGETTSALRHPREAVAKLLLCADHGVPCVYAATPLAGGTAPITVAGHIAQGTAESLLGLVVHQLRQPGAPFIFGIGPAVLDMATSQSSYNAPECLMGYVCAVEMARWLDLPSWGYAGTTDAQVIDAQAGMEAAELTFLSMAIGSNLNHDLGYLDYGMTGSLELIVIMDEYISLNRRIFAGVEVNPETLAVDAVRQVGPGGDFLRAKHTARHVRSGQWRPTIINRLGRARWEEGGGLDLREKARRRALRLLETHQPKPLDVELAARIDALVTGFVSDDAAQALDARSEIAG